MNQHKIAMDLINTLINTEANDEYRFINKLHENMVAADIINPPDWPTVDFEYENNPDPEPKTEDYPNSIGYNRYWDMWETNNIVWNDMQHDMEADAMALIEPPEQIERIQILNDMLTNLSTYLMHLINNDHC